MPPQSCPKSIQEAGLIFSLVLLDPMQLGQGRRNCFFFLASPTALQNAEGFFLLGSSSPACFLLATDHCSQRNFTLGGRLVYVPGLFATFPLPCQCPQRVLAQFRPRRPCCHHQRCHTTLLYGRFLLSYCCCCHHQYIAGSGCLSWTHVTTTPTNKLLHQLSPWGP